MTFAPATIRSAGSYLVGKGFINSGIVGDADHVGGGTSYHLGRDDLRAGAYSILTSRDRAGLSYAASALDISHVTKPRLRLFSGWLVAQCRANAPGTSDIREIIYSPDGLTVWRWDRERGYASAPVKSVYAGGAWTQGDMSHRYHTHVSFYRDAEYRAKTGIFTPYFLVTPPPPDTSTEETMNIEHKIERWTLDGGPGKVTTLGAPILESGTVDYSKRLAYLSDGGGANPRLELVDRFERLSVPDASKDVPLRSALANYAIPVTPDPRVASIKAKVAALNADVQND